MDLPRQPEQLSCYFILHAISSVCYLQLFKGAMGFVVTWQELWMLVGSGFGMVSFGLGRGKGGLISSNIGVYRHP